MIRNLRDRCGHEALQRPLRRSGLSHAFPSVLAGIVLAGILMNNTAQAAESGRPWQGSVGISATYSDNRDGVSTNRNGSLSMQGQCSAGYLFQSGDRTQLKITATPSVKWRGDADRETEGSDGEPFGYFGGLDLDISHAFSPLITLTAGDSVLYTDEGDMLEQGGMVRHASSLFNNSAKVGTMVMLSQSVAATLSANSGLTRYEDNYLARLLNSDTYSGNGGLAWDLGSGYAIAGRVGTTRLKGVGTNSRFGSTTFTYGAGIDKALASDMNVKTFCSYQVMEFEYADLDPSAQWGGGAELSASSSMRTRWSLKADYGLSLPNVGGYSGSKRLSAGGTLEHDILVDRWSMGLHGEVSDSRYQGESETAPAGSDQKVAAGVSCDYMIDRTWSVRCRYTREDWRSDLRDSFTRNVIDAGISASF
jgi:outer membrane scaffolding protein for murein synthesis (MipA/OmpV family)